MKMILKIITLTVLYFVQGLPYGLQDKFIPLYLRSFGFSHTHLSVIKLLLFPWLCKAGFAPFLDLFLTKWSWLILSLSMLCLTSFSGIFITFNNFHAIFIWLFGLNLFSAVQDIAVDGIAIKILRDTELGYGNTAQVLGYKFGALCGGGLLFWIHLQFGWTGLCISLAVLYLISIIVFIFLYENCDKGQINSQESLSSRTGCDNMELTEVSKLEHRENSVLVRRFVKNGEKSSRSSDLEKTINRPQNFYQILKSVFKSRGTPSLIIFLLIYKLGERGALSTFPLFLADKGITIKELGVWSGFFGQLFSILGSVIGGYLISDKWKLNQLLNVICFVRVLPILLQCFIIILWQESVPSILQQFLFYCSIFSLILLEFTAGLVTTTVFTLMMSTSQKAPVHIQGTHYSILSSIEVTGKLMFSSSAGILIDWFGLSSVYVFLVFLSAFTIFVIPC